MISLSLGLDILLVVLLLVTIIYAVLLSRRLSALRSGKVDLEGFIMRMNEASARAEASLAGIRQAATSAKGELDQPVAKAQSLRDELVFLIDRADAAGERLANTGATATPSAPAARAASSQSAPRAPAKAAPVQAPVRKTDGDDETGAPRSKAERDLMNALKNAK
ncbi:MAG: DUF6468 domain-containing protein [Alphaproteobacteria bacterium]|nr:DUF6468 domain-containing protein [Alphaproteobacteria bacterium]